MQGDQHLLGDALRPPPDSPLVWRNPVGQLVAVCPYGNTSGAPHILVIGGPGAGKTSFARSVAVDLVRTPEEKLCAFGDGKGANSFLFLRDQPGVGDAVANDDRSIARLVTAFCEDIEQRYKDLSEAKEQALKTRGRPKFTMPPPSYLFIDEFIPWALSMDAKRREETFDDLKWAAMTGRQVRGYLRILTQVPYSDKAADAGLPSKVKSVLDSRIAIIGRVGLRPLEARMAFGDDQSDAGKRAMRVARDAGLVGSKLLGLGLLRLGNEEVVFRTRWLADPLDPETTDDDREYVWGLLPPAVRTEQEVMAGDKE